MNLDAIKALADLRSSAQKAAAAMAAFGAIASPVEEWPDVVLEDILDAEAIGDE